MPRRFRPGTDAERTLAMLRDLETTATSADKRVFARDLRIGDGWPPELAREAETILDRFRAEGVAPPSWGPGPRLLAILGRK